MSKVCQITGRKAAVGNNVSHSKRRTKRKFEVNLFNSVKFNPVFDKCFGNILKVQLNRHYLFPPCPL